MLIHKNQEVLCEKTPEGGILYNNENQTFYNLNETGMFIWSILDREHNKAEIAEAVRNSFAASDVEADIDGFVRDLARLNLVRLQPS